MDLSFLSLSPVDIQAFSFAFLFFVTGIAAFFILSTSFRDPLARTFGLLTLFASSINIFAYFYHLTSDLGLAREYRIISQFSTLPYMAYLPLLGLLAYERYLPRRESYRVLFVVIGVLSVLFAPFFALDLFGYSFLIGDVTQPTNIQLSPEPGPLHPLFIGVFVLSALYFSYLCFALWRRGVTKEARKLGLLFLLCASIPSIARSTSWAPWYDLGEVGYVSLFISLFGGLTFAFGTTYAILRHQLFNLRLIAAQVFIFTLWTFIFFKAVLSDSLEAAIPDLALLVATIVLGIFLIRAVLKEVNQREHLEKLSAELRGLNETLELKVVERTEDLVRANAHVESLIENLPVGIIESSSDFTVSRINRAAETMLGVSRGQIVGGRFVQADASSFATILHALPAAPKPGEERVPGDNIAEVAIAEPQPRELQVVTSQIALTGGEKGFIKLIRDVTREKQVERSKSEFVTIAAHQLRTPISALRWTFELLTKGEAGKLTKLQQEIVGKGNEGAQNLVRIVNDLLNVAKISDGKLEYHFTEGNLRALIEESAENFRDRAAAKEIQLDLRLAQDLPRFTYDEEKLKQALGNLIDNSLKYTPSGGVIRVGALRSEDRIVITIEDSGIGIPKAEQGRLFEKFFRSKRATQMFTDGSGLGLFLVRTIVEAHGGTVSVASQEGKGTTFTISLPIIHRTKLI